MGFTHDTLTGVVVEVYGRHKVRDIPECAVDAENRAPKNTTEAELRNVNFYARQAAQIDAQLRHAVDRARMHHASWSEIGAMLGTSKQAAQQRYGKGE